MALNIRKVTAQRAENNQKNYKKDKIGRASCRERV